MKPGGPNSLHLSPVEVGGETTPVPPVWTLENLAVNDYEIVVLLNSFPDELSDFVLQRANFEGLHPRQVLALAVTSYVEVCQVYDKDDGFC